MDAHETSHGIRDMLRGGHGEPSAFPATWGNSKGNRIHARLAVSSAPDWALSFAAISVEPALPLPV